MTFPKSLTSIGSSAFEGCSGLTSVDASKCIKLEFLYLNGSYGAEYNQFMDCDNLTIFEIGDPMPPNIESSMGSSVFNNAVADNATLKVPDESIEAYKASDWADYFDNIVPLD